MPFQEPNRRDSWPPTILRLHDDDDKNDLHPDDIDDNPFAYFLTSPPEDDDLGVDFFEDLSAGIEADGPSPPPVREVSPSSLQRRPLDQNPDSPLARVLSFPSTLRDFTLLYERRKYERRSGAPDCDLDHAIAVALRGRRATRPVGSGSGRGRGRGQTRSLSASRGHAWREPSPEMASIPEEREDEDGNIDDVPALGSDANDSEMEARVTKAKKGQGRKKTGKKVHWADLPVRDT